MEVCSLMCVLYLPLVRILQFNTVKHTEKTEQTVSQIVNTVYSNKIKKVFCFLK